MSPLAYWIHTPFMQALGWTLLHFLWEGAALAAVMMAALRLLRGAPAQRRYAVACLFLATMPLGFGVTLALMWGRQPAPLVVAVRYAEWVMAVPMATPMTVPSPRFSLTGILDRLAWLAPLWFAGVAFFYARGVFGWISVQRLRRRGVCAPPPAWQWRLDRLAARLQVSRPVVLLESCLTDTPVLVGYLRPVILLPLGCLTGLSTTQVECILLHELAHVVRHDYLVNLAQSLVEGLLFYHPAVWWASQVVRAERENCCDDQVVDLMGDPRSYAATLAALEQRRSLAPQGALAATGGSLIQRIRRLTVESRGKRTPTAPAAAAGLLLLLFAMAMTAVPAKLPMRHPRVPGVWLADAPQRTPQTQRSLGPYGKWAEEEVVYIITEEERAAWERLASDEERKPFIEQFWKQRDPTPHTPENEFRDEHYRRLAYANEHFAFQSLPGWKTDRGRIYIIYGPPDEIDNRTQGQRSQDWRYRFLDGVGSNVTVEFIDPQGAGEFRLTMDPTEKGREQPEKRREELAKVFLSNQQLDVSVIVAGAEASGGTIAEGDVLSVSFPATASKHELCAALQSRYQRGYPPVETCLEELRTLEQSGGPPAADELRKEQLLKEQLVIQEQIGLSSRTLDTLPKMEQQLDGPPKEVARALQTLAQLEANLANNRNQQRAVENGLASVFQMESRALVGGDGRIALSGLGEFAAAGLTPQQLEATVGRGARIQIAQSRAQTVTILVKFGDSRERHHCLGEVKTASGQLVQTFEDVSGDQAVAKSVRLGPGKYQVAVAVKNQSTGAVKETKLDFAVE